MKRLTMFQSALPMGIVATLATLFVCVNMSANEVITFPALAILFVATVAVAVSAPTAPAAFCSITAAFCVLTAGFVESAAISAAVFAAIAIYAAPVAAVTTRKALKPVVPTWLIVTHNMLWGAAIVVLIYTGIAWAAIGFIDVPWRAGFALAITAALPQTLLCLEKCLQTRIDPAAVC